MTAKILIGVTAFLVVAGVAGGLTAYFVIGECTICVDKEIWFENNHYGGLKATYKREGETNFSSVL